MAIWRDILAQIGIGWGRRDRRMLRALLNGYRGTALLHVAVRLGLPDLLAEGPKGGDELAGRVGAHAPSLSRLLRGLCAIGVCLEGRDGRFGLTSMGALLCTRAPRSMRGEAVLFGQEYYPAWGDLLQSVMTGEPAFERVFGMSQWEHRERHPELDELFNAGMDRGTQRAVRSILSAYDFSRFGTVTDVGGGHGVLLGALLEEYPTLSGVLVEQTHVAEEARARLERAGLAGRCRVVAGSFFEQLPAGADACILKSVIHDWDDERALAILRSCRAALRPQGTLLLIERLLPQGTRPNAGTVMMDLQMLVVTGGRERSPEEHGALLTAAGFRPERVIPTRSHLSIVEAVRPDDGATA